jgi:hypothetical protein
MPGINSAADKSPLSPKTSYYNNMTGELVVPKSVDVGVNYVANGNKSYKNSTLGKYLTDTMAKVKSEATTKVKAVAGTLTKIVSGKLVPITGDTETTNTVNGAAGSFMTRAMNKFTAVVGNTETINTVSGRAGLGMKLAGMAYQNIVGDTFTTNTVKGAPGAGMTYTFDGYKPITKDTVTTNTVNAKVGNGMMFSGSYMKAITADTTSSNTVSARVGMGMRNRAYGGGIEPNVSDTTATVNLRQGWWGTPERELGLDTLSTSVPVSLDPTWGYWGALSWLNLEPWDLATSVPVYLEPMWRGSAAHWLGLDDITATVTNVVSTVANVARVFNSIASAAGGIFQGGKHYSIPQYASGTSSVSHGTLFWAGEAGPEIVGHAGGRTEVLNKSQLAAAMYQAVNSAMQGVTLDANFYGGSESAEDNYDTMYQAMYDAFSAAMAGSAERDREKVQLLRQINDKDFSAEITTSSMNKAQERMNRRAGITLVPVGT